MNPVPEGEVQARVQSRVVTTRQSHADAAYIVHVRIDNPTAERIIDCNTVGAMAKDSAVADQDVRHALCRDASIFRVRYDDAFESDVLGAVQCHADIADGDGRVLRPLLEGHRRIVVDDTCAVLNVVLVRGANRLKNSADIYLSKGGLDTTSQTAGGLLEGALEL